MPPGLVSCQIRLQDFTFRGFPTQAAAHLSVPLLSCRWGQQLVSRMPPLSDVFALSENH